LAVSARLSEAQRRQHALEHRDFVGRTGNVQPIHIGQPTRSLWPCEPEIASEIAGEGAQR
jgi:hypothetical protein